MELNQETCKAELEQRNIVPKKFYGQVFTTDGSVINKLIDTIKSVYRPGSKIIEIGGGLGYITEALTENFNAVDSFEYDKDLFEILCNKFTHNKNLAYIKENSDSLNKIFIQKNEREYKNNLIKNKKSIQEFSLRLINKDILEYNPDNTNTPFSDEEYMLVGNIPFHISGQLYRKFMSDYKHKPYAMVFITDKQYATTLMGQPPRCYRVSLQAQAYGKIEIVADVPPSSVYPPPKVMSCIMKITHNPTPLPENFWETVNYHFENFPTPEVESPKTMSLQDWIDLADKTKKD